MSGGGSPLARLRVSCLCVAAAVAAEVLTAEGARADFIAINPRATYLRVNQDPGALAATPINLSSLSFRATPGTEIWIELVGAYNPGNNQPVNRRMVAVFSSSATLLDGSQLNRVPGAIDAGTDITTVPTAIGGLTTNIAQDFAVARDVVTPPLTRVQIAVPTGARYLFVSPNDAFFGDNTSIGYGVSITSAAVPEPSSAVLLGLTGAVAGVVAWRRRRIAPGRGHAREGGDPERC